MLAATLVTGSGLDVMEVTVRLDGLGSFVNDMRTMIRFYRDILGFGIKASDNTSNVYLVKDGTLFCSAEEKISRV